jgi:hypothetical protein
LPSVVSISKYLVNTDFDGQLPRPPFPERQPLPSTTDKLNPRPDSYKRSARLKDKNVLITGGSSGIGRAVAMPFARERADLATDGHMSWSRASGRLGRICYQEVDSGFPLLVVDRMYRVRFGNLCAICHSEV